MKVTFGQAVERFLADRAVDGYKPSTLAGNKYVLGRCLKSVGPDIEVKRLTRMHVTEMIEDAVKMGNGDATINTQLSIMSAFFRWARAEGIFPPEVNPMQGRRYRRVVPRDHTMVNLSEFPILLDVAEQTHARDRAYIAMGLYTLMRQSEIRSLRIQDINLELNTINAVIHKTSDRDSMRIVPELRVELRHWLTYYAQECGPLQDHWHLIPAKQMRGFEKRDGDWVRRPDKLMPTRAMSKPHTIVHRALSGMGWDLQGKHIGSHTLRRSAARAVYEELVADGVDDALRQTGAWLHHRSVTTTELYLGLRADRERRNVKYTDAPLYPSLQASNVTALRSMNGEARAAGM